MCINDIAVGHVIKSNDNKNYVVLEINLNGEDDFYSTIRVIEEWEYEKNKGNSVAERELITAKWLDKYELGLKEIECLGRKDISKKIIYTF